MTNEIPKEAKEKLLKRIKDTFSSKNPEKFLLVFISEGKEGTSTGFLSGYNDMETLGHIEKIKLQRDIDDKIQKRIHVRKRC